MELAKMEITPILVIAHQATMARTAKTILINADLVHASIMDHASMASIPIHVIAQRDSMERTVKMITNNALLIHV